MAGEGEDGQEEPVLHCQVGQHEPQAVYCRPYGNGRSGSNLLGPTSDEGHGDTSDDNFGGAQEDKVSIGEGRVEPCASHVGCKVGVNVGVAEVRGKAQAQYEATQYAFQALSGASQPAG